MKLFFPHFNQRLGKEVSELKPNPVRHYASCECLSPQEKSRRFPALKIHSDVQDITSDAWRSFEQYIEDVRALGGEELNPLQALGTELYEQILTLPPSIANLKSVKYFSLYGSHLVRIPAEIGEMTNLQELDVYTSYRLHWLPYEITRCAKLKRSRMSTRALYGNYKYRPPFPLLPQLLPEVIPNACSVWPETLPSHRSAANVDLALDCDRRDALTRKRLLRELRSSAAHPPSELRTQASPGRFESSTATGSLLDKPVASYF